MSISEEKKIVIRLPRFEWSFFFNLRLGAALLLAVLATLFGYWYLAIRPYLWVGAHVEAFSVAISSDTTGRLSEAQLQEGDWVKRGQRILSLENDTLLAQQEQTKYSIDSLGRQVEMEKERFEKALESYLSATGELEIGLGSEEKVKRQLSLMEESQEKSEAALQHLAAVQEALVDLDAQMKKLAVAAPFDGVILKKCKQTGSAVSFGDPVYILCDPNRIWVEAEIPEKEIGRIEMGAPVQVRLPAYPSDAFVGKVSWIGPATVAKSASLPFVGQNEAVPVRISLENPPPSLRPGLSAQVRIKLR